MGITVTTDATLAVMKVIKNAMGIIIATEATLVAVKVVVKNVITITIAVIAATQMVLSTVHVLYI